jgi:hypothetical protein
MKIVSWPRVEVRAITHPCCGFLIIRTRLGTKGSESLVCLELSVVMLLPGGSGGNSILWSSRISGVGPPAWNMDNVRAGRHPAKGLTKFSNSFSRFKSRGSSCESVHALPRRQDPFVWYARQKGTDLPFFL